RGTFVLASGSKAFAPDTDDLVFGFGPYTAYLPAGTLEHRGSGMSYYGAINGALVKVLVQPLSGRRYSYSIAAQSVDLSHWVAPASFDLYVGDNAGSATVAVEPR